MYENILLENINKIYIYTGKCDYQQHYRAIIKASLVSTNDRFTDNSPMPSGPSVTVINTSAIESLHIFTEVLDVIEKNDVFRVGASK